MSGLTWAELGERWPDSVVAWDALGAPFEAVFRYRDYVLHAIAPDCVSGMHWRPSGINPECLHRCRCLRWDGAQWLPRYITAELLLDTTA